MSVFAALLAALLSLFAGHSFVRPDGIHMHVIWTGGAQEDTGRHIDHR